MRVQYASDLHLEVPPRGGGTPPFASLLTPSAPYLALCGDVGRADRPEALCAFLTWCAARWRRVFYVPGNHEFYGEDAERWLYKPPLPPDRLIAALRDIAQRAGPNVHLLHREAVYLPEHNVAVVGATLWSHVPPAEYGTASTGMNDYRRIAASSGVRAGPATTSEWHAQDVAYIDAALREWSSASVLVLTHHLPTSALIHPQYEGHPLNVCFASDCSSLLRSPVRAWLCGHTHTPSTHVTVGGIVCAVNPRGYPGLEAPVRGFCATRCVDVPDDGGPAEVVAAVAAPLNVVVDLDDVTLL